VNNIQYTKRKQQVGDTCYEAAGGYKLSSSHSPAHFLGTSGIMGMLNVLACAGDGEGFADYGRRSWVTRAHFGRSAQSGPSNCASVPPLAGWPINEHSSAPQEHGARMRRGAGFTPPSVPGHVLLRR
jgi:hypothetical protein